MNDNLAQYLNELLRQRKTQIVKDIFYSQHPDWQRQHMALLIEAEKLEARKEPPNTFTY